MAWIAAEDELRTLKDDLEARWNGALTIRLEYASYSVLWKQH
jgi:hypothetical protein